MSLNSHTFVKARRTSTFFSVTVALLVTASSVIVARCTDHSSCIELRGVLTGVVFDSGGSETVRGTNQFILKVWADKWSQVVTIGTNQLHSLMYDGADTYFTAVFDTSNSNSTRAAMIRKGSTAIDGTDSARVLWIAYLGKAFFAAKSVAPFPIPWSHPSLLGADSFGHDATWLDSANLRPASLKIWMSDQLWRRELSVKGLPANEFKPFADKEVVGVFTADGATNIGSQIFPQHFRLERFGPVARDKTGLMQVFEGWVHSFMELTNAPFMLPPPDGPTGVIDFRLANADMKWLNVRYMLTNGAWISTNSQVITNQFATAVSNYPAYEKAYYASLRATENPQRTKAKRGGIIVLLGVSAGGFLIVILITRRRASVHMI